jgi:hypothetical protein
MRDYGVVRVRFWDWAKRKKLTPEAKEMALYLLTCPHGNSLGCFRLPMAYLCDDLGVVAKAAAKTLTELQRVGFIHLDEEDSGWTWIVDYLEHNPMPNGNVGKAVGKMLEQVPRAVSFYADLLASLHGLPHFPPNLIDTLRERYLKGSDTVSRPIETHTQTHTHDPIHEHDQGEGAGAPPAPEASNGAQPQTSKAPNGRDSGHRRDPGGDRQAGNAERGTRLPDDWQPDEGQRAFALEQGLDPDATARRFRNHWHAKPGKDGRKARWGATWENWCTSPLEQRHRAGNGFKTYEERRHPHPLRRRARAAGRVARRERALRRDQPAVLRAAGLWRCWARSAWRTRPAPSLP